MPKSSVSSILDSATTLFAEQGVSDVSLAEIASLAKISPGLIIYHFKSKDNLLFILSRELLSKLHRTFLEVTHAAKTPLEALLAFVDAFFAFAEQNKAGMIFLAKFDPFLHFDLKQFPKAELLLFKIQIINMIKNCILQGVNSKNFVNVAIDTFSVLIWSMLLGICHTYNEDLDHNEFCREIKNIITQRLTGSHVEGC